MTPARTGFPAAADSWLVPASRSRVLTVGRGSAGITTRLLRAGTHVSYITEDVAALAAFSRRQPTVTSIVATGAALPFPPSSFDVVVLIQEVDLLLPSVAAEFARVLVPGGQLSVAHTTRDDSVPWVRRLAKVLQAHDPRLMTSQPVDSLIALTHCSYFPQVEKRTFRTWVPITREGMLEMVSAAPKLAALPEPQAGSLLARVAEIYDSSARQPEPLSLPYAVQCWRAAVDHTEFTSQLELPGAGLQISL
jgi:SAM-dependent methyltransferase